jgi:hypothetical protein
VGAAASRIIDDELDEYINSAISNLYDMLVAARGDQYYSIYGTVPTVSGDATYLWTDFTTFTALGDASDFYRLVALQIQEGTEVEPLDSFEPQEEARLSERSLQGSFTFRDIRYTLNQNQLYLVPTPNAVWTIHMDYIPIAPTLASPSSSFDGINGWEEWVILTAAIRCGAKDKDDISALVAERAIIDNRIQRLAGQRDLANPGRVQDVRRDWFGRSRRSRRFDRWDP